VTPSEVPGVDPAQLTPQALALPLIDVREDDEWAAGHAPQARHIPLAQVPDRVTEIPPGALVVCRGGGRSARAVAWLAGQGVETLNVTGGMGAWAQAGLPMTSENGETPAVV